MKKYIPIFLALTMLTACGGEAASESEAASMPAESASSIVSEKTTTEASSTSGVSEPTSVLMSAVEPQATQAPKSTAAPNATAAPTQAAPATDMSGGSLPLDVATNSDQWWKIDSTDGAYWAVADNINAIRAAGGLGAVSVDDGLSAAASARCENFVAGGAFDHSGMTTKSEICAAGGITSASAVCTAWQGSPNHYANIMRTDISSMGIGCWFCYSGGGYSAFWVVTFQ